MVRSSFPEFSRSVTRPCAKPCSLITAPRRVYTRIHARSQKTMPSKFLWPIKTRLPRGRKNISRSRVERQRKRERKRDLFTEDAIFSRELEHRACAPWGKLFDMLGRMLKFFLTLPRPLPTRVCVYGIFFRIFNFPSSISFLLLSSEERRAFFLFPSRQEIIIFYS